MRFGGGPLAALILAGLSAAGCSTVIGDFSRSTPFAGDSGSSTPDGATDASREAGPPPADGGDGGGVDAPSDSATDASADVTIEVGPPGAGGIDLTAGGIESTSANYKLIGVLGESPGGNLTSQSTSYKLYGGVIGASP